MPVPPSHPPVATAPRPVRDGDGLAVAALIKACFAEYPGCLFLWDEFPELRAPASWAAGRGTRMWVLDGAEGAIDGCICATADVQGDSSCAVELHKFYLAGHLRGSGLANLLMAQVFEVARALGAGTIVLWTDTRFTRAHRFYEKLGFMRQPGTRLLGDISDSEEFFYTLALTAPP